MIHNFNERLAWSERGSSEPFWDAVYRKAFPNLVNHMQTLGDTTSQRLGIDRVIHLSSGKTLYVDEKKRSRDWGDVLLEYVSVDRTGAPGWMEKELQIDYLAYAFMDKKVCHLFDWPMLRRAWLHHKRKWLNDYDTKRADNGTYMTLSVAVPLVEVRKAVSIACIIDVSKDLP